MSDIINPARRSDHSGGRIAGRALCCAGILGCLIPLAVTIADQSCFALTDEFSCCTKPPPTQCGDSESGSWECEASVTVGPFSVRLLRSPGPNEPGQTSYDEIIAGTCIITTYVCGIDPGSYDVGAVINRTCITHELTGLSCSG